MNFDYDRKREYKKWIAKKDKEEKELKKRGVNEMHIMKWTRECSLKNEITHVIKK